MRASSAMPARGVGISPSPYGNSPSRRRRHLRSPAPQKVNKKSIQVLWQPEMIFFFDHALAMPICTLRMITLGTTTTIDAHHGDALISRPLASCLGSKCDIHRASWQFWRLIWFFLSTLRLWNWHYLHYRNSSLAKVTHPSLWSPIFHLPPLLSSKTFSEKH